MGDREGPGCGLCGSPAALSLDLWGAGLPFRTPKATVPLLGGIRRLLHPSGREKFGEESGRLPSPPPLAQRSESPGWPAHLSLVVHSVRSPSSAKQADLLRTDPGSVGPRGLSLLRTWAPWRPTAARGSFLGFLTGWGKHQGRPSACSYLLWQI